MARIRSIKPEFWVSEQIAECSMSARLTFVGLWAFCDDRGVHPAKPKTLKAELFPMDDVSVAEVTAWMEELIRAGLVRAFEADGAPFWHVTGWARHQKIDRPSFKYPVPPEIDEDSPSSRRELDEASSNSRRAPPPGVESKGVESKGGDRPARKTGLPADFGISARVKAWALDKGHRNLDSNLEALVSYAKRKGAMYVDWDEALMTAIRENWARAETTTADPFAGAR